MGWPVQGRPLSVPDTVAALVGTPGLAARLAGADRPQTTAASASAPGLVARGTDRRLVSPPPLIKVEGLDYSYPDGHAALEGVSFSVERGDFTAIVGANGAGKTTLASLISGVLQPPRGKVFLDGADVAALSAPAIAEKIGHVFQNPEHQFVSDTLRAELGFSLSPRTRGRRLTPEEARSVDQWLDRLGLLSLAEANPFSLSQGQKRRLSVAAMLIRGCPVLVLDEPTLGQDEAQAARLMQMMGEFRAVGGTVVTVTHDMSLVAEHANKVLVLARGRGVYSGSPAGLFRTPVVVETAGLGLPAVARVALGLEEATGAGGRLLTIAEFASAAGVGPADVGAAGAGQAGDGPAGLGGG
jgi:energy-coupling factor transport system ATP-binding protein